MSLRDAINEALKDAMRTRDAARLSTIRLINAAIKDKEIALRGTGDDGAAMGDDEILSILARMVKQRQESARAYEEGGRLDLAGKELAEITVIETFLPKPLTEAEVAAAIDAAVAEVGAASIRDMGRVMGALKARYPGRMDFGAAGALVKARLG
jgi:hypothetical protein